MMKTIRGFVLAVVLIGLVACGKVVTPEPTVEPAPAGTPLPADTPTSRPSATAPLTPPPATATATVTPTPIVHVVQSGDTLLSIAFDYGVNLQALQTVNGIDNPQFLQVGQELVIPTDEEETESAPGLLLPTPTPIPFRLEGIALHETPVGSLWCMGEIVNTSAFTLTNVQVHVALFGEAGERLTEVDAFADADLIPPGERSPFRVLFTNPPPGWATPQVSIVRGEAAGALDTSYLPIAITELDGQLSESQLQVSGVVQNASADQTAGSVNIIVTTYDAQRLVTGVRQGTVELEGALAPGATAPFTLWLTFHGDTPVDFNVIALGRTPAE
jgi:LysM repeat protein